MIDPLPGWNRNLDEEADAEWWKEYLNQVVTAIPLQDPSSILSFEPFMTVGHSSLSINPRFIVDEELGEENGPPLDFSDLLDSPAPEQPTLDLPIPHAQPVADLPQEDLDIPTTSTETIPPITTAETTPLVSSSEPHIS